MGKSVSNSQDEVLLSTRVSRRAEAIRLDDLAVFISAQTGVKIEVAEYLRGRTVSLNVDGVPARQLLNAICELYDWSWRKTDTRTYLISRRAIPKPKDASELPAAFQVALPRDVRDFLYISLTPEELGRVVASGAQDSGPVGGLFSQIAARTQRVLEKDASDLFEQLKPRLLNGEALPTKGLNPDQVRALSWVMLLKCIHETGLRFCFDQLRFPPYLRDPRQAIVYLQGNRLMVMAFRKDGVKTTGLGFGGVPIDGPIVPTPRP